MKETHLHDLATFELELQQPRVLLFKHSPTCAVSAVARQQFAIFRRQFPDVPAMFVDVVADRSTARGIADRCGVRHESPQVILFERGRAVWHAEHDAITAASLASAFGIRG